MYGAPIPVREFTNAADVVAGARNVRSRLRQEEDSARFAASLVNARKIAAQVAAYERKKAQQEAEAREAVRLFREKIIDAAVRHYKQIDVREASTSAEGEEPPQKKGKTCYGYPIGPSFNADDIIEFVAREFLTSKHDIIGPWRSQFIVRARHCAMWLMRQRRSMSFPEIGRKFGNRDHSTVIHAARAIERVIAERELSGLSDIAIVRAIGSAERAWVSA